MVIRYFDGSYVEGAIRRLDGDTVGVAIAGIDHSVEYKLIQGRWTSRTGVIVTFEFPVDRSLEYFRQIALSPGTGDGHCAAGGECALRRHSRGEAGPPN